MQSARRALVRSCRSQIRVHLPLQKFLCSKLHIIANSQHSNSIKQSIYLCPAFNRSFSSDVAITNVLMPSLSPTMTHGTISSWIKKPGDLLKPGDILCEIETDKASVGFEVQDEGVLAKILVDAAGGELKCGEPIAYVVEDEAAYADFLKLDPTKFAISHPSLVVPPSTTQTEVIAVQSPSPDTNLPAIKGPRRVSPAARHIIDSKSLDVSKVVGTGKGGHISKADVVLALKAGTAFPQSVSASVASSAQAPAVALPSAPIVTAVAPIVRIESLVSFEPVNDKYTDIPNNNMRKVIAKRLTESKATVPHFYTSIECEIDALMALRKQFKKELELNVSVNDIIIKSCALALRDMPQVNSRWNKAKGLIEPVSGVDISVAVATPNGLITPIVTGADKRGVADINSKVKDMAGRARDGKLKPEEYQGGSFSISNLGMFGITSFSAVVNPPQACIMAVGAGVPRVRPPSAQGGKPRVVTTLTVQLSGDRRVVDEAQAAEFLQVFRGYLNNPKTLLL